MIGSFRFEGGAQKTLEPMNLFASGHLSKSRKSRLPHNPSDKDGGRAPTTGRNQ